MRAATECRIRGAGRLRAAAMIGALLAGTAPPQAAGAEPIPELDCVINPSQTVRLSTAEPGLIARVLAHRGDAVEKGDVVAELVADAERTAVDLARARAGDETELASATSRAAMLSRRVARSEKLLKSRIVAESALDELRTELLVAEQEAEAARARLALAALELRRAEQLLARRRIVAPVSGIVVERLLSAGEYFNETDSVATIAVLDPLHVETFVSVTLFGRMREGDIALVRPEAPVGGAYRARVDVVDRVLDAASGTFGVRLLIENPDFSIPAGVNCRVQFPDAAN